MPLFKSKDKDKEKGKKAKSQELDPIENRESEISAQSEAQP